MGRKLLIEIDSETGREAVVDILQPLVGGYRAHAVCTVCLLLLHLFHGRP